MSNLFFYLSGESDELPSAECLAILDAENVNYKLVEKLDQVLIINSNKEECKVVIDRAAYTYRLCELITKAKISEFSLKKKDLAKLNLSSNQTFSVRIRKVKTPKINVDTLKWERDIGEIIKKSFKTSLKVDLKKPNLEFIGIITGINVVFGLTISTCDRRSIDLRQGKNKPRFYPGIMHPRLAKAMVNLAHLREGDIFIDPFLGTGGIALEAGIIGCRIIGIELEKKMVHAAIENLKHYKVNFDIIYGDSKHLFFENIDGGATDPPYGISTSTHGTKLKELITKFLSNIENTIKTGGYFTIAVPSNFDISKILNGFKLKIINSFDMYVHRSLTRRIIVLRR